MNFRKILLFCAVIFCFTASFRLAFAGFGITPPYVVNEGLVRGSVYEQKIILTRNDPVEDLQAQVTINVPGAGDWISIDKGTSFLLPKNASQVPMVVRVTVPKDAKFETIKGNIRVVISPVGGPTPGTVGIALGAQIDVKLGVVDRKIESFDVRVTRIADTEEGHSIWKYFLPGKIRFSMQIENTGNVAYSPTKVVLTIRDSSGARVLETDENLNGLKKVTPFNIDWVVAEIPTYLTTGSYRASFAIYDKDKIASSGELNLSVQPRGSIANYAGGFGFLGLRRGEQVEIIVGILLILSALWWIIRFVMRFVPRRK